MKDTHALIITIKEIFQTAFISFGLFLIIYIFLIQPHRVQGISMQPSFENGELLLTEKVSYRFSEPKKGDVVVFEAPIGRKADFIKRIIATEGDTIKIDKGEVSVNGIVLDENYTLTSTTGDIEITIEQDKIFVMGDNRSSSSDSRSFGTVETKLIRGRVWLVYWPLAGLSDEYGFRLISIKK